MIKIENVDVAGWEAAIRGMRNPMNSWQKSDSCISDVVTCFTCEHLSECPGKEWNTPFTNIGPNDHSLMMKLRNAGTDHRKFMRMIAVYLDITAPLYWWKEFDTYKVGTVANSCSTMHKIHEKEFTLEDFSCEHLLGGTNHYDERKVPYVPCAVGTHIAYSPIGILEYWIVPMLNYCRELYLKTKDKNYWWQMIQLLPSSYNQKRTVMLNYEVLANIYKSRKDHKLDEWREFCKWVETLPYSELIRGENDEPENI